MQPSLAERAAAGRHVADGRLLRTAQRGRNDTRGNAAISIRNAVAPVVGIQALDIVRGRRNAGGGALLRCVRRHFIQFGFLSTNIQSYCFVVR